MTSSALNILSILMLRALTPHASFSKTINCVANEECVVPCSDANPCSNSIINCPSNGDCEIHCNDAESCKEITVNGPTNHDLSIYCNGVQSCFNSTFKASQASSLSIEGCLADQSCLDLTIYCPPRQSTGAKSCFVEGNDNLGAEHEWRPMHIYARNGWLDIDIDYNGTYNHQNNQYFHVGIMHCTNASDYDTQCVISVNGWTCKKPSDYCNNPTPIAVGNITTTKTSGDKGGKKPITINIDMDKMLLPFILSLVLMCCLIGAFCIWYRILCVKGKKKSVISPPITLVNDDKNGEAEGRSHANDVINDIYRPSVVSSQDSPALSSIGVRHSANNMRKPRPHTVDIVDLQHSHRKQSHSNRQRHGYNVSNMSNVSIPVQAQRQIYNHKQREASVSSLALPSGKRGIGRHAHRGSESSHDRSFDQRPFNVNDLEGSGIKDQAEYDPEGFSINRAEDIEDDDIASELPQSPPNRMMDENDSSHSDIYLESSHHGTQTPQMRAMSEMTDITLAKSHGGMSVITLENAEERKGNKANNNATVSLSDDSGSDDMYLKGNQPAQSPMGPVPMVLGEIPQRKHQMSMDIATDVSVY